MRISEPSFTDSYIDPTGKTENQTCTRVDGRSAPSTLSLPKSASAGGLRLGFPWERYYDMWSRALDLKCSWAIGNFIERRRNAIQQAAKLDHEKRRDNSGETIV
jgi:hypothetical protein